MLTKAFARHREISSTQVYVHTSKEELYDGIDVAFSKLKRPYIHSTKTIEWVVEE